MSGEQFIDYYEILQVSPNADTGTIDRIFRYLAKRYHPDNPETGHRERFELLMKAYHTLMDPEERAKYDVRYQYARQLEWKLGKEAVDTGGFESDQVVRARILSLLYVQRRRDMDNPGVGIIMLEKLLDCPREHLEFHIWYLREKKWIERTDSGLLAITADGIDQVGASYQPLGSERLLTARTDQSESKPNKRDLLSFSS
jgi:curved DNA-binding protein CbpA